MKQVSYWASKHVAAARLIIILLYIPLNILGYITGSLLWDVQVELTPLFINSTAVTVVLLYITYQKKAPYYQKKLYQFTIGVCTFCIICFYGNQSRTPDLYLPFSNTLQAVSVIEKEHGSVVKEKIKTKKETRQLKKELRKKFRKAVDDKEGMKTWVKILLIVLSVLVALILLYGVAGLACTLSCNGSEAAAWLVGILGLAGIAAGLFFVIRAIIGRKRKPKKDAGTA